MSFQVRDNFGLDFPKVADLLRKSKKTIHYNNHILQKDKPDINTCGRWVIWRANHKDKLIDDFVKNIVKTIPT